jgi:hypothetical protein
MRSVVAVALVIVVVSLLLGCGGGESSSELGDISIFITSPSGGSATLAENQPLVVTAVVAAVAGIDRVSFEVAGPGISGTSVIGVGGASPVSALWNTLGLDPGNYVISVVVLDNLGQTLTRTVPVTIQSRHPGITSIALLSPLPGAHINQGTVTSLIANANAVSGVDHVDFMVDGELMATDTSFPYQVGWPTAGVPFGLHLLTAVVEDKEGHRAGATVEVTVSNPLQPEPAVDILAPSSGVTVAGEVGVTFRAQAMMSGVTIDCITSRLGSLPPVTTYASTAVVEDTVVFDTTLLPDGTYNLVVTACDSAGMQATDSVYLTVDNLNSPPEPPFSRPGQA